MISYLLAAALSSSTLSLGATTQGWWDSIAVDDYKQALMVNFGNEFTTTIKVTHRDLNNDGRVEVLISSLADCGSAGYVYSVYSHDEKHTCHVGEVRDPIPDSIVGLIDCQHRLQPLS